VSLLAARFLCFFSSCPSLLRLIFLIRLYLLASNLMSASLISLSLSLSLSSSLFSVLLHNRSLRRSACYISSSPLPPSLLHWHLRRPVFFCQTAIPQIEISWVLKSLRQIYHLNEREGGGGRRTGLRCRVCTTFWFDNSCFISAKGAAEMDRSMDCVIWVYFSLTDYPNVTINFF